MKKVKFKINGMHCNSCSLLIEEKLKNLPGVIKSKINYESGKGVIIYDENAINETKIQGEIESVGEYSVEKIEDAEKEEDIKEESCILKPEEKNNFSSANLFLAISIVIAGLIIGGAIIISSGNANIGKEIDANKQTARVLPTPDSLAQPSQLKEETFNITKDNHIRGDFNVPITLVEFSDFECPFSGRHYPTMKKILSDYNGKVRIVYKHFPLGFHQDAQKAAEASECADEQGKFWEYHDKLFENLATSGYSLANFKQWAKDLGLNSGKFNECLDSGKYAQKVQADFQEGSAKGVTGTPATFVNGQLVSGALPYDSFKQIIDGLLNK